MSDEKIAELKRRQDDTDKWQDKTDDDLAEVHTKIAVSDERHKHSEDRQDKTDAIIRWVAKLIAGGSVSYLITVLVKKALVP